MSSELFFFFFLLSSRSRSQEEGLTSQKMTAFLLQLDITNVAESVSSISHSLRLDILRAIQTVLVFSAIGITGPAQTVGSVLVYLFVCSS